MLTMEDVERAFCELIEKESLEYDPDCCEVFYHWTCGVTDLLRKIRFPQFVWRTILLRGKSDAQNVTLFSGLERVKRLGSKNES